MWRVPRYTVYIVEELIAVVVTFIRLRPVLYRPIFIPYLPYIGAAFIRVMP